MSYYLYRLKLLFVILIFREQIQQYTQQLAKDTSTNLKELNNMPTGLTQTEQRQFRMQRERLTDEFTAALNAFQATQRTAAAKVKEQVQRSRALAMGDPFAPGISFYYLKNYYNIFYLKFK